MAEEIAKGDEAVDWIKTLLAEKVRSAMHEANSRLVYLGKPPLSIEVHCKLEGVLSPIGRQAAAGIDPVDIEITFGPKETRR